MAPQQRTDNFSRHTRQISTSSSNFSDPLLLANNDDECTLGETSSSLEWWPESKQRESRNVTLILAYTCFVFAGRSIWAQNVLSTFVFLLRDGDPKAVGFMTAAMGLAQLLVSFPSGFLADKYRRDRMLKVASFLGVVAIATTLIALHRSSYYSLLGALFAWGCFYGVANPSVTALFADSIRDGQRAQFFTTRSILVNLGNVSGPAVALTMFAVLGDKWTIKDCSIVMTVGQLVALPAVLLLCFLNDDAALQDNDLQTPLLDDEGDVEETGSLPSESLISNSRRNNLAVNRDDSYDQERLRAFFRFLPEERIIPMLVAAADVTSGMASGMSIPYLAIFLFDNLHVTPVKVQVLYMMAPLLQALLMKAAHFMAKRYGRCRMAAVFKWIGITLMFCMVASYVNRLPVWVTCILMVLRTGFMNSTSALTGSVVMDHVPKEERAKWSALESLNMFSWSGSAVIGGMLVAYRGVIFNFCVTASLQFVATMPYLLLSLFRKKESCVEENEDEQDESSL